MQRQPCTSLLECSRYRCPGHPKTSRSGNGRLRLHRLLISLCVADDHIPSHLTFPSPVSPRAAMSSSDLCLQRAHAYLEDARDKHVDVSTRVEAFDAARTAILDARRARASPAHLLPLFTSLCTHAAADRAHTVRAVLPAAVEDLVSRDMQNFAKPATPFLTRALHDEHVLVAARAVRALTTLFRKVVGFVVATGVGDADGNFPRATLAVWLQMQHKALSLIHAQDEGLRKASVKFAETVVLAFTFSGSAGSADHFTLDYLVKKGSDSPSLDPRALEEEGIRSVKSIAQLVHTSLEGAVVTVKPDSRDTVRALPPMSFMTAVSVLGNLVRRRRKIIEYTLPPFLSIVAAVVDGSRGVQTAPKGVLQLSESQRHSIIHVLRFNLLALRPYPHTRAGRAGVDIAQATTDLESIEREEEARHKERASELAAIAARERAQKEAAAAAAEKRRVVAAQAHPGPSLKRPREATNPAVPWPRFPPKEALAVTQTIVQSMPPQEVVNFIMTRLMLNIPPAENVPGAQRAIQRNRAPGAPELGEEPTMKRPRKSRFGSKEPELSQSDSTPPPQPPKKVAIVRKVAPAVVPVRLSSSATEKLVTLCCRRILKKESQAIASGAGPLRVQLLARLMTKLAQKDRDDIARKFCDEVCAFLVDNIEHNIPLTQAWLFCLASEAEIALMPPASDSVVHQQGLEEDRPAASRMLITNEKSESETVTANVKTEPPSEEYVKTEPTTDTSLPESPTRATEEDDTKNGDPVTNGSTEPMETKSIIENDVAVDKAQDGKIRDVEMPEELEDDDLGPLIVNEAYNRIFNLLLELLKEKQSSTRDFFSDVICDAPVLPSFVVETLKQFCHDPSRIKLGLHTLRDIVLKRPGNDRSKCLSLLLGFTVHGDEVLRGPSIRLVANKIFVECVGEVPRAIEKYAVESLNSAIRTLSEVPTADDINSVERGSLLVTALCGQKHELLREIASLYINSPPAAKQVLLSRAKDLAAHLGMSAVPVIELISAKLLPVHPVEQEEKSITDGLEELALEVLRAVLKKFGKPTEEIVEAARLRHDLSDNTAFIIAVLPGLRKEFLLKHLAAIVNSAYSAHTRGENGSAAEKVDNADEASQTAGFKEIIGIVMSSRPPAVSPAELLIELHHVEPSAAVSSAIRACFELKSIYKQEVIAQAIQQLIEKTVIPDLFMRTVHLARIFYGELEKYLTGTVLKRLIDKHVWKNALLWEGFLMYCSDIKKESFKVLVSLPAPQLADALKRQEGLLSVFKSLFANPKNLKKIQSVKHRKVIQAAIQKPAKGK